MRSWMLILIGILFSTLIAVSVIYLRKPPSPIEQTPATALQTPSGISTPGGLSDGQSLATPTTEESKMSNTTPDLNTDTNGLSKSTVVMATSKGTIKFKFYPKDAPKTVNRIIELVNQGFYNGLTFHRVVPGFVVQGGDPVGNGTGGSGKNLEPEFNSRRHVEGTVAMARAADPASADSQFYISLGTHPHLDRNYTVFGQVVEGMDVVKKIGPGDKMTTVNLQ